MGEVVTRRRQFS